MSTLDDRLIDTYLDQLRRELQASPEEEEEILREVRSHLLFAAQDLAGHGDEAPVQALAHFGSAKEIGQELRQVHGRATWGEAILAALPLLVLGTVGSIPQASEWLAMALIAGPLACLAAWVWAKHRRWPLWGWAWLGCLPLVIPNAPLSPLWGALAYLVVLLLVRNRNWLEATLTLYPLPTVWAFHRTVLASREVQLAGWSAMAIVLLGLGMAATWMGLLVRLLRTPSGRRRVVSALEHQGIIFVLNTFTVVAARLWPTNAFPYPFSLRYFVFATLPYAVFNGLPYLLFTVLTSLPAILALLQTQTRRGPPSRPLFSG
jgi:hypothetical protein